MNIKTMFREFENPDGYSIDNVKIEFVQPEQSVNFVLNPEVATLNGYSGTATFALDSSIQAYGINSISATFDTYQTIITNIGIDLDGNTSYTFSVAIIGNGDFELYFTSNGSQVGGVTKVTTTNHWHRYSHTAHFRNGVDKTNATAVIKFINSNSTATVNLDGFQVEAKPYPTTFISGTRRGNFAGIKEYYWNGNAHDSVSTRSSSTTTGGRIINLSDLGIDLLGITGFGMLEVENFSQNLALKQISLYTGTNYANRQFELLLNINSVDHKDYLFKRNSLIKLINSNRTSKQQPVRILLTLMDCEKKVSETVYIDAVYVNGLAGEYNNFYNERFALSLIAYDPTFKSITENTCELAPIFSSTLDRGQAVITNSNVDTQWEQINNIAAFPQAFTHTGAKIGPDGKYWVTGLMAIDSKAYLGTRWNGNSWEAIGEFNASGTMQAHDVVFINNIAYFVGIINGSFGSVVDSGNGVNVVGYDIQTDSFFQIGEVDGPVFGIATDGRYLYIGGQFNNVIDNLAVTTIVHSVARYDTITDTWSALPSSGFLPFVANGGVFNNGLYYVNTVAIDNSGVVWFGGNFTISGTEEQVTRYSPSLDAYIVTEPLVMSTAPASPYGAAAAEVRSIIVTRSGDVYAGGRFDSTYSINANPTINNRLDRPIGVAKWNGNTWLPLQALLAESGTPGFSTVPAYVYEIVYNETENLLYAVGQIDYAGQQYISPYNPSINPYTYLLPNNGAGGFVYNGSTWKAIPINFGSSSSATVSHLTIGSFFEIGAFTTNLTNQTDGYGLPAELQSSLFLGINSIFGGPFEVPAITSCENTCGDLASPIITIVGPGTFSSITNLTNDSTISFADLVILDGQVVTIDLTGITPVLVPNDIKSKLNRSSNLTTFRLSPGLNYFEVFYKDITENSKVYVTYNKRFLAFDAIGDC